MTIPKIPKFTKTTWSIIAAIPVVIGIVTGVFKVDDRYAKANELKETKKIIEKKSVETFEAVQQTQKIRQEEQRKINAGLMLSYLSNQQKIMRLELKNKMKEFKENPNDIELQSELEDLKHQMREISREINELRKKLLGVEK